MLRENNAHTECSPTHIPRNYPVYGKGDGGSMGGLVWNGVSVDFGKFLPAQAELE